jgi:hypothetical protein
MTLLQIFAVIALLNAFGVSPEQAQNVQNILMRAQAPVMGSVISTPAVQPLAIISNEKIIIAGAGKNHAVHIACDVRIEWITNKPTSSNSVVYDGQAFKDTIGLGTSHMATFTAPVDFTGYLDYIINSSSDTESQSLSDTVAVHMGIDRLCF